MKKEIFRMERVTYQEQSIKKLDYCNLNIYQGEILGFLPVNAYGLTSFINILKSNLPLYDGYIYYNELLINSWKQSNKQSNRITVIENTSCLVDDLTVTDNIFVLRQNFRKEIISSGLLKKQLKPFLDEIHMSIPADLPTEKLTAFERIVVEIVKGVVASHKLIVLNEVQNLITDEELLKLHDIIRFYAKKGISFLYIAVHFENIIQVCHRAVFFQNGRVFKVLQENQLDLNNLALPVEDYRAIVHHYVQNKNLPSSKSLCEIHHPFSSGEDVLHLEIKQSECVTIQCLDYQMHNELMDALIKFKVPPNSHIKLDGVLTSPADYHMAIINECPDQTMIFPEMSYMNNLCFGLDRRMKGLWLNGHIKKSLQKECEPILGDVFHMHMSDLTVKQKYKLVYTRILLQKPKIVACIQPFKGADMELRMYIFTLLEQLVNKGISVIILSINLADSLSIADRLVLLERGKPQMEYLREQFTHIKAAAPWKNIIDD